jgi:hypothetical protein
MTEAMKKTAFVVAIATLAAIVVAPKLGLRVG